MKTTFNKNTNRYDYEFTNRKGEEVVAWITQLESNKCIVNTLVKGGYIDKIGIEFDCELEPSNENYIKIINEIERFANQ